jgi:hypothetical protein
MIADNRLNLNVSRRNFHFAINLSLLAPLYILSIANLFFGRPAADDYCNVNRHYGGSFFVTVLEQYINGSGRPTFTFIFGTFENFNTQNIGFIATRITPLLLTMGITIFLMINYRRKKIAQNMYGFVASLLVAIMATGNSFINYTWLPGLLQHTFPFFVLSGIVYLLISNSMTLVNWMWITIFFGLWVETFSIATLCVAVYLYFFGQDNFYRKNATFFGPVVSLLVLGLSPGNWQKLSGYNSPFTNKSIREVLDSAFTAILQVPYYVLNNPIYFITLFFFGTLIVVEIRTFILSISLFAAGILTAGFLGITANPGYARVDYMMPISLGFILIGNSASKYLLSNKKNLMHSTQVVLIMVIFIVSQALGSTSIALGKLTERAINWDKAARIISIAKSNGETEVSYLKFNSDIAEPGNYAPALNCASGYFGIILK